MMTKRFKSGEKGFTLVELLIVVAILGVLAAVVIPNVVGLLGRGGTQAYETDEEVIQLAAATFYADTHAGGNDTDGDDSISCAAYDIADFDDNVWQNANNTAGHYYPTAIRNVSNHVLVASTSVFAPDTDNPRIDLAVCAGDVQADDDDIDRHAIWMGLMVNTPGEHGGADQNRETVAPLADEDGPYLNEMPESCGTQNGTQDPGGYVWVVGRNGTVFGVYTTDDGATWYAGFAGAYP